jgi:hypothetical protein
MIEITVVTEMALELVDWIFIVATPIGCIYIMVDSLMDRK